MKDRRFFDTNVLVYAFDLNEPQKRASVLKLISNMEESNETMSISTQVLLEFYSAVTTKISVPIERKEAAAIINDFAAASEWIKLEYTLETARKAAVLSSEHKVPIWDALIAETMKENGVDTILTENEKDFKKVPGIKVINPFK